MKGFAINSFSGNGISLAGTNNDVIQSNYVGTDPTGTIAKPNGLDGVFIYFASVGDRIGTNGDGVNDAAERNPISGNTGDGVGIFGSGTNGNFIAGNYIGTDVTGATGLPNSSWGVHIYNGPEGNLIGGSTVVLANTIDFNILGGVSVVDFTTTGNTVRLNSIYNNLGTASTLGPTASTSIIWATLWPVRTICRIIRSSLRPRPVRPRP